MTTLGRQALLPLGLLLAGTLTALALVRGFPRHTPTNDELRSGSPLSRTLGADTTHLYRLGLKRGEYLHLIVEQKGLDVIVAVRDPHDRPILEVDGPTGEEGREQIFLIAREGGRHTVAVRSGFVADRGSYRILVDTIRQATRTDRAHTVAALRFARGDELRRRGGTEDLEGALALYRQALEIWRRLDQPQWQATAHEKLGWVFHQLGTLDEAAASLEAAHQLLPADREATPARIRVVLRLGWVRRDQGRWPAALAAYEEGLALARLTGRQRDESAAINNIALVYKAQGRLHEAAGALSRALTLVGETGDVEAESMILGNLGELCAWMGLHGRAEDFYTRALALNRDRGAVEPAARNLAGLATVERRTGDLEGSLARYREALRLLEQAPSTRSWAEVRHGLGLTLVEMGRFREAEIAYREAEIAFRDSGRQLQGAWVRLNAGWLFDTWGRHSEALQAFSTAREEFRSAGDLTGEGSSLFGLARTAAAEGDPTKALGLMEEALAIIEGIREDALATSFRAGFLDSKYAYYQFLVDLLVTRHQVEPSAGFDRLAFIASERARARSTLDQLQATISEKRLAAPAERLDVDGQDLFELLERTVHSHRVEERGTRIEYAPAGLPLSALLLKRDVLEGGRQADLAHPPVVDLAAARQLLAPDTALLVYNLGEDRSFLWWLTRTEFQVFVLPGRLEIEHLAHAVYEALHGSRTSSAETEPTERLLRLSEILLGPVAGLLDEQRLIIVPDGTLHLLPFSVLQVGRPGAEAVGLEPLVARHEITRIPSVSVLAMLRERELTRRSPPGELAIVADPVFSRWDPRVTGGTGVARRAMTLSTEAESRAEQPAFRAARDIGLDRLVRLEASGREGRTLASLAPASRRFLAEGFAANRETVRGGILSRYRIVHFATHALLNIDHPELSGIILSLRDEAGEPRHGFLPAYEVYDLELPADLVVLSACRTGLGKHYRGEGLTELPQSFLYAGATRVVVSLWDVEDEATAAFMESFYRALLEERLRPSAALRAAQLEFHRSERWRQPVNWAGFVLLGD